MEPSYAPRMKRYQLGAWARKDTWEEKCIALRFMPGPPDAVQRTNNYFVTVISRDNGDTWGIESKIINKVTISQNKHKKLFYMY
ncbi:MAG: hypothetical protein Q7J78_01830 [Clostridiales bacterium]|nr:hypothetical protein [Clostridiales bacterium]